MTLLRLGIHDAQKALEVVASGRSVIGRVGDPFVFTEEGLRLGTEDALSYWYRHSFSEYWMGWLIVLVCR